MNKLTIALIVAGACIAGGVGGVASTMLINQAQVVHAQPKEKEKEEKKEVPAMKIALVNMEIASRNLTIFGEKKIEYEKRQEAINAERKMKRNQLDALRERLREYQATNKSDEAAAAEVEIKAKEQEIEFADDVYKHYLSDLRDKYLKDVLTKAYDIATKYCERNGFHMLLQDYTLADAKSDDLFSGKVWSETLMNKIVLFVDRIDPKAPRPNEYITDITPFIVG